MTSFRQFINQNYTTLQKLLLINISMSYTIVTEHFTIWHLLIYIRASKNAFLLALSSPSCLCNNYFKNWSQIIWYRDLLINSLLLLSILLQNNYFDHNLVCLPLPICYQFWIQKNCSTLYEYLSNSSQLFLKMTIKC